MKYMGSKNRKGFMNFEEMTPQWITDQMLDFQIKNPRQLSIASGVRYESLNLALNKKRELSSEIKKTLWWYFRYLDEMRQIQQFER